MKADNGNQQFWGRWSGSYDGFMGSNSSLYEEMALRMKRRLSRQMCVLELACGTGLISQRLAGSVKSLEATDYAPEMIAEARKKVHSVRLHFSVQNATCLPGFRSITSGMPRRMWISYPNRASLLRSRLSWEAELPHYVTWRRCEGT